MRPLRTVHLPLNQSSTIRLLIGRGAAMWVQKCGGKFKMHLNFSMDYNLQKAGQPSYLW